MMHSNSNSNKTSTSKCSYKQWELVLHGSEQSPNYLEAMAHVEHCSDCQLRLESCSTMDIPWWGEAKESWLESELPVASLNSSLSSVAIEISSEMPDDSRVEFETVMLSFLDAPSHPELLGRLGRYEVERVIGTGGMGIVLKAHDTELHRVVAIKILAAHLANSASARKRFAREAQAAAAVLHPNVIPIYNVESEGKLPYLVMQCVSGHSLQSKVDRTGKLPLIDTLRIAKQTAAGLAAAHDQGLVHRDVKPANILLEENVDRVILSDFGLARAVDDASLTRTGVIAGTPHYMSPEQAHGDAIDTRSDQFSLGSVMYFMLTGRPPFRATGAMGVLHRICNEAHRPIEQVNEDVPEEVVLLIDRLLSKNPADRFETMHCVETEIELLLAVAQSGGFALSKRKRRRAISVLPNVSPWIMRSLAFGIPALMGAAVAFVLIWQLLLPNLRQPSIKPQSIHLPSVANEWGNSISEDIQFQADVERIEQEIARLQQYRPFPFNSTDQDFDREVQRIERQIQYLESQSGLQSGSTHE